MAVEAKRGCGYRKVGGIYLVADGPGMPCDRLPLPLGICPTCSAGIKQTRSWTWVDLKALAGGAQHDGCRDQFGCPLCLGHIGKAGLLWIGERFYKTPADYVRETDALGVSRRISTVPREFKLGETWVLLAHPKAIPAAIALPGEEQAQPGPGIFHVFRPERLELIITETQSRDPEYMAGIAKRGLTPVVVPDNDKDHQGSVYDAEEEEPALQLQ